MLDDAIIDLKCNKGILDTLSKEQTPEGDTYNDRKRECLKGGMITVEKNVSDGGREEWCQYTLGWIMGYQNEGIKVEIETKIERSKIKKEVSWQEIEYEINAMNNGDKIYVIFEGKISRRIKEIAKLKVEILLVQKELLPKQRENAEGKLNSLNTVKSELESLKQDETALSKAQSEPVNIAELAKALNTVLAKAIGAVPKSEEQRVKEMEGYLTQVQKQIDKRLKYIDRILYQIHDKIEGVVF
jgi:hypothetical protein